MNVGRKLNYRIRTTELFVKLNKLTVSIVGIFSEQGSVEFSGMSKRFKTQEIYNTYIKVNKSQFIKIIYDNTSCILQCASALIMIFNFFV